MKCVSLHRPDISGLFLAYTISMAILYNVTDKVFIFKTTHCVIFCFYMKPGYENKLSFQFMTSCYKI